MVVGEVACASCTSVSSFVSSTSTSSFSVSESISSDSGSVSVCVGEVASEFWDGD